jgi:hypothetical protein
VSSDQLTLLSKSTNYEVYNYVIFCSFLLLSHRCTCSIKPCFRVFILCPHDVRHVQLSASIVFTFKYQAGTQKSICWLVVTSSLLILCFLISCWIYFWFFPVGPKYLNFVLLQKANVFFIHVNPRPLKLSAWHSKYSFRQEVQTGSIVIETSMWRAGPSCWDSVESAGEGQRWSVTGSVTHSTIILTRIAARGAEGGVYQCREAGKAFSRAWHRVGDEECRTLCYCISCIGLRMLEETSAFVAC